MEIKDKKLVSVLAGIIIVLLIALGALYFSTPQGMSRGDRPEMPANMQQGGTGTNSTGTKNSTNSTKSKNNTSTNSNNSTEDAANSSSTTEAN